MAAPLGFWEMKTAGESENPCGRVDGGRWDKEASWPNLWGLEEKRGGQDLGTDLTHGPWGFVAKRRAAFPSTEVSKLVLFSSPLEKRTLTLTILQMENKA